MPRIGDIVVYHLPACDYPAIVLQENEDKTLNLCVFTAYASVALARSVKEGMASYRWSYREDKPKPIADYKTSELVEELKNRLGVECMECNPYESYPLMANSGCDYGLILAYDESLGE